MKTLFLCAAAVIATAAASSPASAGSVSIGDSTAHDCFQAAVARSADRNGFYHCNLALYQEALSPQDRAATLVNRGALYLRGHNYTSAGRDFDAALKSDAGNAEAWLNLAIVNLQQGGSGDALPMIEKSLTLNTERQALAYYSRSIAYERLGRIRDAYGDLQRAHGLAPAWREPTEDLKRYEVHRR